MPESELKGILTQGKFLQDIARWIGVGTAAANHCPFGVDSNGKAVHIRDADTSLLRPQASKRKRQPSPPSPFSQSARDGWRSGTGSDAEPMQDEVFAKRRRSFF